MEKKYLSKEKLAGFENYKYSSLDTSILSIYVMHPFWNWCVQFCPKWVAPNLLTFSGFILTILSFVIFSWYDYGFYGKIDNSNYFDFILPRWAWLLTAIFLFIAYTLDGIDGKQARRTGTSGPLGEMFDHGVDSYTAILIPTCLYTIFGRNGISPLRMFCLIWNILINFYLSHWEKYNTGVMYLPWIYDLSMVNVVLVLLITSVMGPRVWDLQFPGGFSTSNIYEFLMYFLGITTNPPTAVWNIYKSYRDKTGKMRSFYESVRPLYPFVVFLISSFAWAILSPNNIIDKDPRMFYIITGTIFSNICCRLIVCQMSDTRGEIFNMLLCPFCLSILIILTIPVSLYTELFILYALTIISTITHIHYGIGVVREMCEHFKIQCFKIKYDIKS